MKNKILFSALLVFLAIPLFAFARIAFVSLDGSEFGREGCVVVTEDPDMTYYGDSAVDYSGDNLEAAARACLGFLPAGIIDSVDNTIFSDTQKLDLQQDLYPGIIVTNTKIKSVQEQIVVVESKLVKLGYLKTTPNSVYDSQTASAVRTFQKTQQLPITGIVDKLTWLLLLTK